VDRRAHASAQVLAISRRLAQQDPGNAGWQRDLALALTMVGDVLQADGWNSCRADRLLTGVKLGHANVADWVDSAN